MELFSPSAVPPAHRIDRKFLSAYRYLKICLTAKVLYLLLKIAISLVFLPLIADPLYYAWLLWLFVVSCLQTGYNTYLLGRYTHRHAKLQIASGLGYLETVKFDQDFPA